MSHYIKQLTNSLKRSINTVISSPAAYLTRPDKDFTRNRKINLKTLIGITMNSGGGTMNKELLNFFDFNLNTPSVSAYTQQRAKLSYKAFQAIFENFTKHNSSGVKKYRGYRLIACDGSNLSIARNPYDRQTAYLSNQNGLITNHLHLNALYDVLNRTYEDVEIQNAADYHEHRACIDMIKRSNISKAILIADRGYENYNLIAHAINCGWKFLIRIKDPRSNGIASGLSLSSRECFDADINLLFTRNQTLASRNNTYKWMPQNQIFDFLPPKSHGEYLMAFRIVRFKLDNGSYETVITNLGKRSFTPEHLKELYHLRWGIETSFRELKYSIGLTNFHSKKPDFIRQEIYARLVLYNYCELVISHAVVNSRISESKTKQVNFTAAIYICREYLRNKRKLSSPDVIRLIEKYILPLRPGRQDPRKVKNQSYVSFIYRVS